MVRGLTRLTLGKSGAGDPTSHRSTLPLVAGRRPKSLLEWNVLLAAGAELTEEERAGGKRLPVMRQAAVAIKAMPRATRVAEFIALWTITKYQEGATSPEKLSAFWAQPERTMYRRLEEFRAVWGPAGYDTPDVIADNLIAEFKARHERLTATDVAKLVSSDVALPPVGFPGLA